jgi:hypothetical protein
MSKAMNAKEILRRIPMIAALCGTLAFAVGCGGGSGSHNTIVTTGSNVAAIEVSSGPDNDYANGAFTSVQVCVPSTSNCQTIPGVLVDTGSVGLRLLSSVLQVSLPQQNATNGDPIDECLPFAITYTWGPVETADVQIASETASAVPIQVIGTSVPVPQGCKNFGGTEVSTLEDLGANGILGVGSSAQDCAECATASTNPGLYYECPTSGCVVTTESLTAQVQNPVSLFQTDNNGVIIELPSVDGAATNLSGSLVFGIGTQSNNGLGSATVYTIDDYAEFSTTFNGSTYPGSFLDSGSNGLYFLDSSATGIPVCSDNTAFYCPSGVQNLSATNVGENGATGTVKFSVANADTLFDDDGSATAYSQLAGPNSGAFDWGLPFFYGRNVFTSIAGTSSPGGTAPYWAY